MKLVHYSAKALPSSLTDTTARLEQCTKPRGLWVSVSSCKNNWRDFCESEQWGLERFRIETVIKLVNDAWILHLRTPADIDEFTRRFERQPYWTTDTKVGREIDWPAVAKGYDGIIIAPYQWSRRLHDTTRWYYGWDCASGCIWNPRAIEIGASRPVRFRQQEAA